MRQAEGLAPAQAGNGTALGTWEERKAAPVAEGPARSAIRQALSSPARSVDAQPRGQALSLPAHR